MSIFSERMDGARFNKVTYYGTPYFMGGGATVGSKGKGYHKGLNMLGKAIAFRKEINQLTRRMGRMASEHIQNNFNAEGFLDATLEKWPKKRKADGKKTLEDTGRMKNTTRIMNRTRNSVALSTPVGYAGIHNRPVGKMKKYGTGTYPGRMFMGHSKVLAEATKKMIVTRLNLAAQV